MSGIMVWNGSDWVLKPVKFWDGSAWKYKKFCFWTGTEWKTSADVGPAAPVHVISAVSPYANVSDMVIAKPVGVADKHILLATTFQGANGFVPSLPVPPTGFTQIAPSQLPVQAPFNARFTCWWKRAGPSEPLSYTFGMFEACTAQVHISAYSNCVETYDPIDAYSQNSNSTGTSIGFGLNLSEPNEMLVWLSHNWDASGALSPPTGGPAPMTERIDHLTYIADEVIAAAGATGDRSHAEATSNPWSVTMVALEGK